MIVSVLELQYEEEEIRLFKSKTSKDIEKLKPHKSEKLNETLSVLNEASSSLSESFHRNNNEFSFGKSAIQEGNNTYSHKTTITPTQNDKEQSGGGNIKSINNNPTQNDKGTIRKW